MTESELTNSPYLTVSRAAQLLGVSIKTLHNWDRSGKLRAKRHPINGYRLYERAALEKLLAELRTFDPPEAKVPETSEQVS